MDGFDFSTVVETNWDLDAGKHYDCGDNIMLVIGDFM